MNSKTKFTLAVTAMVAVTLLAVVGIMAVFAARQQTFNTSITVVYKSTNVEGTATAQWKLGRYYDTFSWYDFSGNAWQNMDDNGALAGGKTELDLSEDGPLSLSPAQSIDLSDEYAAVAFKYTFSNTATHPYTLNFKYQSKTATKNINSFYAASPQELEDGNLATISNNFTNIIETTVLGGTSENIYIVLKIDDLGLDSIFDGTFSVELTGQTSDYESDYVYLYDGKDAVLTVAVDPNATTLDTTDLAYKGAPVTKIGSFAFQNNTNLQSVTLNGIEGVEESAFYYCSSITDLTIGEDLQFSGRNAFAFLSNLTHLSYNAVNASMEDNGYGVFQGAGLEGPGMDVVIGDSVTNIPNSLCGLNGGSTSWYTNISTLTLGKNIETIGDYAFGCSGLTNVGELNIPRGIRSIGKGAFHSCQGVTKIYIPDTVEYIGENAFGSYSHKLSSIIVNFANENYTSRDSGGNECNVLIDKSTQTLLRGCNNSSIPEDILSIGNNAFTGCSGLTNLIIPESITNIGNAAFSNCSSLTTVVIPHSVISIGRSVFDYCSSLVEIFNKSDLTDDEIMAEYSRNQYGTRIIHDESSKGVLSTVNGVKYYSYEDNVIAIGLEDKDMQGEITLQATTTSIKASAFANCSNLTNLIIPEGVISIGDSAFSSCDNLAAVIIPESLEQMGNWVFSNCGNLTEILNKSSVLDDKIVDTNTRNEYGIRIIHQESEKGEFSTINSVKYYSYDNNVVAIGPEDRKVEGVLTLQQNTTEIKASAFRNLGITSIIIPEGVVKIGMYAFNNCTALTEITIPGSVKEIGAEAFQLCSSLTSLTILNGVNSIGYAAFSQCSLTSINIPGSVISIGDFAFSDNTKLREVTISEGVINLGYKVFGQSNILSITIPASVKSADGSFEDCYRLTEIINKSMVQFDILEAWYGVRIIHEESEKGVFSSVNGVIYYSYDNKVVAVGLEDENLQGPLTLQSTTTDIKSNAFRGCYNITSVFIPESVTNIGSEAFYDCGLTSVTIDCGEEVCNNLVEWSTNLEYSIKVGGTIRAKYEIANWLDYYSNFSKSETQVDGYWVYTKNSEW